jgi:hypothetical protein
LAKRSGRVAGVKSQLRVGTVGVWVIVGLLSSSAKEGRRTGIIDPIYDSSYFNIFWR